MSQTVVSFISAFLASLLFLLFHYGLVLPLGSETLNWGLALALAMGAYAGLLLVLPRKKNLEDELAQMSGYSGPHAAEVAEVIRAGMEKIDQIRQQGLKLKGEAETKVERIAGIAEEIVLGFKEDPSDIHRSKHFLLHYLDATLEILQKYNELQSKRIGPQIQAVLEKSEETLSEIEAAFDKQYQRNLSNEAMELDVNLDVLKNMIKSEGL
jgi:5-bromo-4-chloroindolyl phosphate hydrolysis protein